MIALIWNFEVEELENINAATTPTSNPSQLQYFAPQVNVTAVDCNCSNYNNTSYIFINGTDDADDNTSSKKLLCFYKATIIELYFIFYSLN